MRKMLIISSIVMVLLGTLCGCRTRQEPITTLKKCGYVKREGNIDFAVYYDVNTKVMYSSGAYGKTVLLNSDGTPMLWEGGGE